jgi:hypothetical protein
MAREDTHRRRDGRRFREYAGKTYSSLSKIAQTITGAHWSGPLFFGLNRGGPTGIQSGLDARNATGERDNVNG